MSKAVWVDCGNGRHRLFIGKPGEKLKKLPRHNHKKMYTYSVSPSQAKLFQKEAVEDGFRSVTFDEHGGCYIDNRREQHEYAYYRNGDVMLDGGYFETIPDSRRRQLDALRAKRQM